MISQITVDRFIRNEVSAQYCLHAYEKLLLFMLGSYMGTKSICYPSYASLATDCSISIDSAKRHIKCLEEKRLIDVVRRPGRNNHYTLNLPKLEEPAAESTQLIQPLDAESTTHPWLSALGVGAHSPPNNIINNIKKYTSEKQCEIEISHSCVLNDELQACTKIFQYWQQTMNHPHAKFDKKRKQAIDKALKLGYGVDELKQAIDGCRQSDFHMGKNERKQVYDDIALILRDADHIERFISNASQVNTDDAKWMLEVI